MKKSAKKLDHQLVKALTEVCEAAKDWQIGFEWLTHTADYDKFPQSLQITFVFATEQQLKQAADQDYELKLVELTQFHLSAMAINLKNIRKHVRFDSEEACLRVDAGDWQRRIARHAH